jgi:hypothetical protein
MWILLLACRAADPDALLRRHDLDGASAAWTAKTGEEVDLDHTVADILAQRAAHDPSVTTAYTIEAVTAARLLDSCPRRGLATLDIGFASLASVFQAAEALANGGVRVAVGRSTLVSDRDPYMGGPLPFASGRIVGWAGADAAAFGRAVDAEPPLRLVTVALRDQNGAFCFTAEHRPDGWWSTATSDAPAAARLLAAAERAEPKEALLQRFGAGLTGGGN